MQWLPTLKSWCTHQSQQRKSVFKGIAFHICAMLVQYIWTVTFRSHYIHAERVPRYFLIQKRKYVWIVQFYVIQIRWIYVAFMSGSILGTILPWILARVNFQAITLIPTWTLTVQNCVTSPHTVFFINLAFWTYSKFQAGRDRKQKGVGIGHNHATSTFGRGGEPRGGWGTLVELEEDYCKPPLTYFSHPGITSLGKNGRRFAVVLPPPPISLFHRDR